VLINIKQTESTNTLVRKRKLQRENLNLFQTT